MKLATVTHAGNTRIGVVQGDEIVDLSVAAPDLPTEMTALLAAGPSALARAAAAAGSDKGRLALADVHLEQPVLRPPKLAPGA